VDILVNNAGHGNPRGPVDWFETTEEDFLNIYNANVVSAVRMIRRLVPKMREQRWGRIIMNSSVGAAQPEPIMPDYQASKAAMVNFTVSLSKNLARTGITSNCITPGPIMTPPQRFFLRQLSEQFGWGEDDDVIERKSAEEFFKITLDRLGTPEDVGNLVAFLASPLSGFITGSNYRIDGGMMKAIN
jgi:3-oxoacyl-[acyl-carrier protein] reductase